MCLSVNNFKHTHGSLYARQDLISPPYERSRAGT